MASEIHQNDIGTRFSITVKDDGNLVTYLELTEVQYIRFLLENLAMPLSIDPQHYRTTEFPE